MKIEAKQISEIFKIYQNQQKWTTEYNEDGYIEQDTLKRIEFENDSPEYFEKCKPEGPITKTAADEILFHAQITYPDRFLDLKKDINGYVIQAKNFRTLMPFQSAE